MTLETRVIRWLGVMQDLGACMKDQAKEAKSRHTNDPVPGVLVDLTFRLPPRLRSRKRSVCYFANKLFQSVTGAWSSCVLSWSTGADDSAVEKWSLFLAKGRFSPKITVSTVVSDWICLLKRLLKWRIESRWELDGIFFFQDQGVYSWGFVPPGEVAIKDIQAMMKYCGDFLEQNLLVGQGRDSQALVLSYRSTFASYVAVFPNIFGVCTLILR